MLITNVNLHSLEPLLVLLLFTKQLSEANIFISNKEGHNILEKHLQEITEECEECQVPSAAQQTLLSTKRRRTTVRK